MREIDLDFGCESMGSESRREIFENDQEGQEDTLSFVSESHRGPKLYLKKQHEKNIEFLIFVIFNHFRLLKIILFN